MNFKRTALYAAMASGLTLAAANVSAATNAEAGFANPNAQPKPLLLARCGACNPCKAKKGYNPCNPCAAKKGCNPCNPCAAKKACNPCAAKKACNPCNPCAAKKGCNPCAGKKKKY